ncbi:hypothetical protein BDL97_04G112000 [Sphagnum fallax]|nr:hypothetical protein BDL97_04G112000 [Sphagnum fallax]KAH9566080.1 hypothetical protein CY35_04G111600 [Sphagnum magellanicum]
MKSIPNGDEVLRKGPWMPEEDEILVDYVRQFGARDWSSIRSKGLLPRTGKSCRLRWVNKLKPDLKRSGCKFAPEEEKLVVEMQAKLGNKWAKIASCLPGRTDNDVKNFWSTRQKRILRALQRPKMPSGSTDASADTSDLSKDPSLSDFNALQVHSPTGGVASMIGAGFVPPFIFAEEESPFRDTTSSDIRRLRQNAHSFTSMDVDDVLNIKLEHMTAGVNQRPARSARRRPRSRKDNRACFEHACNEGGAEAASQLLLLPELGLPNLIHQSGRGADLFGVAPLTDSQHNNYLDFLLHPDQGPSLQTSQVFSPELPTFLPTSHQWEKLPMLYSEDPGMQECDNKDTNSCSPDSVITNFSGDVFDSLEPLCPAPSEWWVIH